MSILERKKVTDIVLIDTRTNKCEVATYAVTSTCDESLILRKGKSLGSLWKLPNRLIKGPVAVVIPAGENNNLPGWVWAFCDVDDGGRVSLLNSEQYLWKHNVAAVIEDGNVKVDAFAVGLWKNLRGASLHKPTGAALTKVDVYAAAFSRLAVAVETGRRLKCRALSGLISACEVGYYVPDDEDEYLYSLTVRQTKDGRLLVEPAEIECFNTATLFER